MYSCYHECMIGVYAVIQLNTTMVEYITSYVKEKQVAQIIVEYWNPAVEYSYYMKHI